MGRGMSILRIVGVGYAWDVTKRHLSATTLGYDFWMVLEFRTIRLRGTCGSLFVTGKLSLPNRAFRFFCHD
jgi:hypothetical protein